MVNTIAPKIKRTPIVNNSSTGYPTISSPTPVPTLVVIPKKVVTIHSTDLIIPSLTKIYAWKSHSPMSSKYGYYDLGRGDF